MQYIGVDCIPKFCATVQLIVPGSTKVDKAQFKSLGRAIHLLKEINDNGLDFVKLDIASLRVVFLSDASFAKVVGMNSELGFVILSADGHKCSNMVLYGSNRCQRVSRSITAAEIHAFIQAFDTGLVVPEAPDQLLNRQVDGAALTDSCTLSNVMTKSSGTEKRRLQINFYAPLESYRKEEQRSIGLIPGRDSAVNVLTKKVLSQNSAMRNLMKCNKLEIENVGCTTKNGGID